MAHLAQQFFQPILQGRTGLLEAAADVRLPEGRLVQQLRRPSSGRVHKEHPLDSLPRREPGGMPGAPLPDSRVRGKVESRAAPDCGAFGGLRGAGNEKGRCGRAR